VSLIWSRTSRPSEADSAIPLSVEELFPILGLTPNSNNLSEWDTAELRQFDRQDGDVISSRKVVAPAVQVVEQVRDACVES
jgi:hypothetical protein